MMILKGILILMYFSLSVIELRSRRTDLNASIFTALWAFSSIVIYNTFDYMVSIPIIFIGYVIHMIYLYTKKKVARSY